jgi:thymidine kinase
MGSLTIFLGNMFSGKTSELLRVLTNASYVHNALYINHRLDNRSDQPYSTHNTLIKPKLLNDTKIEMFSILYLQDVPLDVYNKYDTIGIDEAQFFEDLDFVITLVDKLGKSVYVAGLNGDYLRQTFGKIHKLIPHADDIRVLKDAYCVGCAANRKKTQSVFTHRKCDNSHDQIEVGNDNYVPLCRQCYLYRSSSIHTN